MANISERHEVRMRAPDSTIVFVADSVDGKLAIRQEHDAGETKDVCAITLANPDELRAFFKGLRAIAASLGQQAQVSDEAPAESPKGTRKKAGSYGVTLWTGAGLGAAAFDAAAPPYEWTARWDSSSSAATGAHGARRCVHPAFRGGHGYPRACSDTITPLAAEIVATGAAGSISEISSPTMPAVMSAPLSSVSCPVGRFQAVRDSFFMFVLR